MALKAFKSGKVRSNASDKQLKRAVVDGPVCQVLDEGIYTQDEHGLLGA